MRYESAQLCSQPITPEDMDRLAIVYDHACRQAGLSRHHPMAERIAAIAIRFYQLGIRDEETLINTVLQSYQQLAATAYPAGGALSRSDAVPNEVLSARLPIYQLTILALNERKAAPLQPD